MDEFVKSVSFFFALFNPFLMSIYLIDLIRGMKAGRFFSVLTRASFISGFVFFLVAWAGEHLFTDVLFVRFASFQIFGGLIFVVIGIRYIFEGADSIKALRGGDPAHIEGSIAMPFMIGPGTISAAVVIGQRHSPAVSAGAIAVTLVLTVTTVMILKKIHDTVKDKNEDLIERYIDVVGRLSALYIGTIAIEMIVQGVKGWVKVL